MINIVLYTNVSDKRCMTKQLTKIRDVNATLLEPCELDNPVFKLKYTETMVNCNYVYAFGAYYFCMLEFQVGGMCLLRCHKDVMMSNREALLNKKFEISRQENYGFTTIPDTDILLQNDYYIDSYQFKQNPFTPSMHSTFVLQVVGGK